MGAHQEDVPVVGLHKASMVGLGVSPKDTILFIFVWITFFLPLEEDHVLEQSLIPGPGALADVDGPLSLLLTEATEDLIADSLSATIYALAFVAYARVAAASATDTLQPVPDVLHHKL